MRRTMLAGTLVALVLIVAAAPSAAKRGANPAHSHAHGASLVTWQERWMEWTFGSSTNPLLTGVCGEQVGKLFFLAPATELGVEVDCHLPPGTSLLASPGGVVAWPPTDGQTDAELLASRDAFLMGLSDPTVTLDGRAVEVEDTFRSTDVYTIGLEPGNFIQTVDPAVIGDQTRLASAGWFVRLNPLSPGQHELVLSIDFDGSPGAQITFHISVAKQGGTQQ